MNASWSQEGEDVLLARIFADQLSGVYVDVGAHHPKRFSNTLWAYRRGWWGINIDAAPGSRRLFERSRPRDVNLECIIGDEPGEATLHVFHASALNTSIPERRAFIEANTGLKSLALTVPQRRLESVLEEWLPAGTPIDFLTVDVEGAEIAVLQSNDWDLYRPRVIIVELAGAILETVNQAPVSKFLVERGYTPVSLLYHSVFFIGDNELLRSWKTHS